MAAWDAVVIPKTKPGRQRRPKLVVDRIVYVTMPERAPEVSDDATTRRVSLLMRKSRRQLWVCIDDLPWLVQFLRDQIDTCGVPRLRCTKVSRASPFDESIPEKGSERSSTSDASTTPTWDFARDCWSVDLQTTDGRRVVQSKSLAVVTLEEARSVNASIEALAELPYEALTGIAFRIMDNWVQSQVVH
jgi:hypothetical protein